MAATLESRKPALWLKRKRGQDRRSTVAHEPSGRGEGHEGNMSQAKDRKQDNRVAGKPWSRSAIQRNQGGGKGGKAGSIKSRNAR